MKRTYKLTIEYEEYIQKYDEWQLEDWFDSYFITDKIGIESKNILKFEELSDLFQMIVSNVVGYEWLENKIKSQKAGEIRNLEFHFEPIEIIEV